MVAVKTVVKYLDFLNPELLDSEHCTQPQKDNGRVTLNHLSVMEKGTYMAQMVEAPEPQEEKFLRSVSVAVALLLIPSSRVLSPSFLGRGGEFLNKVRLLGRVDVYMLPRV